MIKAKFNKTRAEELLRHLDANKAFEPPAGGWTNQDKLLLAAVLTDSVLHGAVLPSGPPPKSKGEADRIFERANAELGFAVQFMRELINFIRDGGYEKQFKEEVYFNVGNGPQAYKVEIEDSSLEDGGPPPELN